MTFMGHVRHPPGARRYPIRSVAEATARNVTTITFIVRVRQARMDFDENPAPRLQAFAHASST